MRTIVTRETKNGAIMTDERPLLVWKRSRHSSALRGYLGDIGVAMIENSMLRGEDQVLKCFLPGLEDIYEKGLMEELRVRADVLVRAWLVKAQLMVDGTL